MDQSFLPIISGFLGGSVSAGVFKGPVQTLEDLWYINFGHTINKKAEMIRAKQANDIELFKNDLLKEIVKNNPEDINEPLLKILGPALEASKYYIEEKDLRIMFAKIIANSMNKNKSQIIHTSFVEIIKQLDSLDALILKDFSNVRTFNLGSLRLKTGEYKYFDIIKEFYLSEKINDYSILETSKSISNLKRLGLVETTELLFTDIENEYSIYASHPKISEYISTIVNSQGPTYQTAVYRMDVTPYGDSFLKSCVE